MTQSMLNGSEDVGVAGGRRVGPREADHSAEGHGERQVRQSLASSHARGAVEQGVHGVEKIINDQDCTSIMRALL